MSVAPTTLAPNTTKALSFFPAALPAGLSNIKYVSGPTYIGPNSINLLFPFTVSSGVIEVSAINNFNVTGGNLPQNMGATVRVSGSNKNVTSLGPNFRNYIRNCTWSGRTITDLSSISLFTPAVVTQVQQLDESFVGQMDASSFKVTSGAPPTNYALQFAGFGITWVFLTPLTVRARDSTGRTFYITFTSSWDATRSIV
jgi:hypothetical protein